MENIATKNRKANKDHICGLCGQVIKKGEVYEHQSNVGDDCIESFKCHLDCSKLAKKLGWYDKCDNNEGLGLDSFYESVSDAYICLGNKDYEICPKKLCFMLLRNVV